MALGLGWSYGDRTKAPSEARGEYYSNSADDTWEILDLGEIIIPPVAKSDIAGDNSLELRLYQYAKDALTGIDAYSSPTGNEDPQTAWSNEGNAYDDDTETYAETTASVNSGEWSDEIIVTRASLSAIGVRFWYGGVANQINVDAYYDGEWHDVYEGAAATGEWVSKYFSDGPHDVIKFRFYLKAASTGAAYLYEADFITANSVHRWDVDFIFLLPIDEGVVIIDDVDADDIIAVDGISDPPGVFIIDGSGNVEDTPDYVGKPFTLGRESTRLYALRDDAKGVTFTSDVKYQPLFMVI